MRVIVYLHTRMPLGSAEILSIIHPKCSPVFAFLMKGDKEHC